MVEFNNVSKFYPGNIRAVEDINFSIETGEFVFLIGPSGSGKTTVIKMLIRDEVPSSGRVFFQDTDITRIGRNSVYKLRREVGVIFQDFKLIQDKTAFENVAFAMEVAGKKNKEIKDTVPYVLDIVGLAHRMNSFPRQLSGGEQQRVAIARAIANNPKILIADEPTGNLDPASAWDIVQILTKINNWGTTVIMSTHGTDIVNSLNKRVIQMEDGKVLRDDNKGQYEMSNANFESKVVENSDKSHVEKSEKDESEKKPSKKKIQVKLNAVLDDSVQDVEETSEVAERKGVFKRVFSFMRRAPKEHREMLNDAIVDDLADQSNEEVKEDQKDEPNDIMAEEVSIKSVVGEKAKKSFEESVEESIEEKEEKLIQEEKPKSKKAKNKKKKDTKDNSKMSSPFANESKEEIQIETQEEESTEVRSRPLNVNHVDDESN